MNVPQKSNHRLLISFCNQFVSPECSLAIIETTTEGCEWIKFDLPEDLASRMQGITGIVHTASRLFVLTQGRNPALLVLCAKKLSLLHVKPLNKIKDPHSAVFIKETLYIASTGTNQIYSIRVSESGPEDETLYWSYPNIDLDSDYIHLNGITVVDNRIVATCFGTKNSEGKWGSNGRVFFTDTNESILNFLNNPHTPYFTEDILYVAESKSGLIHRFAKTEHRFDALAPISIAGYVRGLTVIDNILYVGVSSERSFSRSNGEPTAACNNTYGSRICSVDLKSMRIVEHRMLRMLGDEIYDLVTTADNFKTQMHSSEDAVCYRLSFIKQRVHFQAIAYERLKSVEDSLNHVLLDLHNRQIEIDSCKFELTEKKREIRKLKLQIQEQKLAIANYISAINQLLSSTSWRITRPIRAIGNLAKLTSRWVKRLRHVPDLIRVTSRNRVIALLRYLIRGDFIAISAKLQLLLSDIESIEFRAHLRSGDGLKLCVLTTRHTEFVAHNIAEALLKHGFAVDIIFQEPESFDHDFYFVLCPQMFRSLPPGQKRVTFQFEQSVSERWFNKDYIDLLRNSFATFDYSQINIAYLAEYDCAYPHVFYMPVGATSRWTNLPPIEKKTQVLFYGDYKSSPRRRSLLDALDAKFSVERIDNLFGEQLRQKIRGSKVVVNLHYYEGALLETTRIQECLSLGARVVSENSPDLLHYPELTDVVKFFECGDKTAMIKAVENQLLCPLAIDNSWLYVHKSAHQFEFMLDRFLFAAGFICLEKILSSEPEIPPNKDFYAISLPETQHRRNFILSELPPNSYLFDGVRFSPGWIGCALSYIKIFQMAEKHNLTRITIMEDDVILPANFDEKYKIITEYLDRDPDGWHIFSGLIAILHPETQILKHEVYKGVTFVTIDRMTSMVFNIYNQNILPDLLNWDASNHDANTNTIDKYIEGLVDLRVVVALPFFAGHREEAHSTLWGIENTHYADLIATTEKKLSALVLESKTRTMTS
jgi:Domain of unknown function (DUF4915)/Glycosyltransferase family 25 (LPS biosynthesis protein)